MLFLYFGTKVGIVIFRRMVIKSFKHNGRLHRQWLNNWRVPEPLLHPAHAAERMIVFVNEHTPIVEADGSTWTSRSPGVSYFVPGAWYNVVALIEPEGIRYYCNVASPPYESGDTLTYIDYDLDVIVQPDGSRHIVDVEEYELHQSLYHYSAETTAKAEAGLTQLLARIDERKPPFDDAAVIRYYELWRKETAGGDRDNERMGSEGDGGG